MAFTLPDLPYDGSALEPHIDTATMKIHHGKHHAAYVANLNKALEGAGIQETNLDALLVNGCSAVPENIRTAVRNNGGGHWNHSLFWEIMSPKGGGEPVGNLAAAIKAKFGDVASFKEKFAAAGMGRFGSGWAWLVKTEGGVDILSTPNQDNPLMEGKKAVIGVDVWEHAYYLHYQNRRADYLAAWWNVVNWAKAEEIFNA
ncbi:MAG: superoxide dismutase [Bryobacterales bacterium]|nr:superoxide dismutase [Bryobacterales bacterium]